MQAQGQPPQQYYPQQQQPQQYYPQQQPQQYEQQQAVQPQMTQDERRELEAYRAQQRRAEESARREQEQAAAAVQQQQAQAPAPAPEPEVRQPEFGSWGNAAKGGAIRLQTGGSAPTTGGTASQTPAAFTATPQTTGLSADALARNQAGWMASGKMTQDQYNQAWQNWNAISQGPGIIPAAGASNPSTSTPSASTTSTSAATSQPQQAGSSLTPAQMTTTAALTPEQQTQAGAGLRMRMQPSLGFDPYSILAPQTRQRGGTILDRSPSRRQVLGSIR
jgi:hypothetical protein